MNHARRDLCGGCPVMGIPTAIARSREFPLESAHMASMVLRQLSRTDSGYLGKRARPLASRSCVRDVRDARDAAEFSRRIV